MWPRLGSFVPGPMLPSTNRGRSGVAMASAACRAILAPASASSLIRSGMSYSLKALRFAPKVLVSTQSAPAAR